MGDEKPPPLPGPGIDLPVDCDGSGTSTYGDRYFFNWWLANGGSLALVLSEAQPNRKLIDLTAFFASPGARLSVDAAPYLESGIAGAGAGGAPHNSHIDFTRQIPPNSDAFPAEPSVHARATTDGRYIVFASRANLAPGGGGIRQIYRASVNARDQVVGMEIASVHTNGTVAGADCSYPSVSYDGKVIVFSTRAILDDRDDSPEFDDVYVRDLRGPEPATRLLSLRIDGAGSANNDSLFPCVSADGNVCVFTSSATDLIASPVLPPVDNVFRVGTNGPPAMAWVSRSDIPTDPPSFLGMRTTDIDLNTVGKVLDNTGNRILFEGAPLDWTFAGINDDNENTNQVFLRDVLAGRTFLVSRRLNVVGDGASRRASIGSAGTMVAFSSLAESLDPSDTLAFEDVFLVPVSQVVAGNPVPTRVTAPGGVSPNGPSLLPMLDGLGNHIVFMSSATNLVTPISNGFNQIFLLHRDQTPSVIHQMSEDCTDEQANDQSFDPDVFLEGRAVVYQSRATNLIDPTQDALNEIDGNGAQDIFETRLKPKLVRGDSNQDGFLAISDGTTIFNYLFQGADRLLSFDVADVDDNGQVNLSDGTRILNFLFQGGPPPNCPFGIVGPAKQMDPFAADFDPTDDSLSCKNRPPYLPEVHDHGGQSACQVP
jgi:hypothetical protein